MYIYNLTFIFTHNLYLYIIRHIFTFLECTYNKFIDKLLLNDNSKYNVRVYTTE